MIWFRLFDDLLDDPKIQKLPPDVFKCWINLLCLANKNDPRGTLPTEEDIAFRLRMSEKILQPILITLDKAGLIEKNDDGVLVPHHWEKWQKPSDDSSMRVAKHRAEKTADRYSNG